jgi:hypothetical protein
LGISADDTPETKSKARSETAYPYFGLGRVAEIVKAVQRAGGNEAPAAAVFKELGLTKPTERLWAYGIPASSLFGLIEKTGRGDDARLKLTPLGLRLALPGTPDEERRTKAEAINTPELYQGLLEKFKILESMAGNAAEAFLDSLAFAELITPTGTIAPLDGSSESPTPLDTGPANGSPPSPPEGHKYVDVPHDYIIYRCKITRGRILDLPLPPNFTAKDAERIHAFLLTQVDDEDE